MNNGDKFNPSSVCGRLGVAGNEMPHAWWLENDDEGQTITDRGGLRNTTGTCFVHPVDTSGR